MKKSKQRVRKVRRDRMREMGSESRNIKRLYEHYAGQCLKLGRRLYRKMCEVDDSVEIIARELARQPKRKP